MRRAHTGIGIGSLLALLLAPLLVAPLPEAIGATAGTLDTLAADLDEKLALALKAEALRRSDLALSLRAGDGVGARLGGAVRALVLGRLAERGLRSVSELRLEAGADARTHSAALVRRARAGGYELLLDLELALVGGHLHLRGVLRRTDRSIWRDLRQPDRGALSHLHASARVDAEIRAYQGSGLPAGTARFTLHSFTLGPGELLALGAGDVDGDGRVELVALRPRAVEVYRRAGAGAGAFQPTLRFKLASPPAALRPRRPLGALVVADLDRDGKAEILARTSELERGVELGLARDGKALLRRKEIVGYPLAASPAGRSVELVSALAQPGLDLFAAASLTLAPAASPDWVKTIPATFYSLRSSSISSQSGPRRFVGVVDASGGFSLIGPDPGSTIAAGPRAGIAFDLCDLDDDGSLELIGSGAEGPEVEDGLAVYRLVVGVGGPSLKPLWRSSGLGGQVVAITHADLDGNGKLEVVAAVRQRGGVVSLMVLQ
jgi:hypothetical protein